MTRRTPPPPTPSPPFDIDDLLRRVREAGASLPKPALFALADDGYRGLFEQLVACMLSARTRDEVTNVVARRLFAEAPTPAALAALPIETLVTLVTPVTYPAQKASYLADLARRTVDQFAGTLPCDEQVVRSFRGVGPKCAHLALGIACGIPLIAVDIHVHRVVNRWGVVATRSPETTMRALETVLPQHAWVEINRLLVPFGKQICTPRRPHCSACPIRPFCQRVGVTSSR